MAQMMLDGVLVPTDSGTSASLSDPYVAAPDPSLAQAATRASLGLANVASSGLYNDLTGQPPLVSPATVVPLMDATVAAIGDSLLYARQNHVHPTDSTRLGTALLGVANGVATLDGSSRLTTAQIPPLSTSQVAEGSNLYYTNARASAASPVQTVAGRTGNVVLAVADVSGAAAASSVPVAASATPLVDSGVGAVGSSSGTYARGDHQHPVDTSRLAAALLGVASGVASLDGSGKLTPSQIPAVLLGAVVYQGTWNASSNSPALSSGAGTKGWYYKVATAGSTTLDGISQWNVGDTAIYDGSTWDKIDGIANEVISVNGLTGALTLTTSNIAEGANLYFTAARASAAAPVQSVAGRSGAVTLAVADVSGAYPSSNPAGYITSAQAPVQSVAGRTGAVTLAVADVSGALSATTAASTYLPLAGGNLSGTTNVGTASANYVTVGGAPTGYGPAISASGSDANLSLVLQGKGSGTIFCASPLTLTTALAVAYGGTGANSAAGALSNLGAYAASNPSGYITSAQAPVQSVAGRTGAVSLAVADVSGALSTSTAASTYLPLAGGTITDPTTGTQASLTVSATGNSQGAGIKLIGQGSTTPSKTIRAYNGQFQVVNDAYNSIPLSLDDTGNLSVSGTVSTPLVQFPNTVGAKINLYGNSYGLGIQPSELTLFSGVGWAFRQGNPTGTVVASISSAGQPTFAQPVPVASGGTGATTAPAALSSLGAYAASNPAGYITSAGAPVQSVAGRTGAVVVAVADVAGALPATNGTALNLQTDVLSAGYGSSGNLGNQAPTVPTALASMGWNYTAGGAEVDFINGYTNPALSFAWHQKLTANSARLVMRLGPDGTLTTAVPIPVSSGGTGATTAPAALSNLGAYAASNPAGYITAAQAPVQSVAGRTGAVTLAVADVSGAAPLASPNFTGTATAGALLANVLGANALLTGTQWQNQGGYVGWNITGGGGETDFVNSRGGGAGGFNFYNTASAANAATTLIASLDSTGTLALGQPLAVGQGGTGSRSAAGALSNLGAQASLGYAPVQQGTGVGQNPVNVVKIGWTGGRLKSTVDTTDLGNFVFDNNAVLTGTAQVGTTTTTLGQQTVTGTATGSTIGSNIVFNNGWKYVASDYGWFIRADNPGTSFNVVANGTANAAATPIPAWSASPTGVLTINNVAISGGTIAGLSAPLPVGSGGTGATAAAAALSNLGGLAASAAAATYLPLAGGSVTGSLNVGTSGANYVTLQGTPAGYGPGIAATGSDANVSLVLQAKGSGAVYVGNPMALTTPLSISSGGTGANSAAGALAGLGAAAANNPSFGGSQFTFGLNSTATTVGFEIGSLSTASFLYQDLHSSGTNSDFDVRLSASGGSSASGQGNYSISAASFTWNGNTVLTTGAPVTVAQGGTGATTAAAALVNLGALGSTTPAIAGGPVITVQNDFVGRRTITGNYGVVDYYDGSNYYFLVTTSGQQTTTTYSGIRPFHINLSSGLVSMDSGLAVTSSLTLSPGIANTVARDLRAKLTQDILSVKDFGALGDGTTDDTTAIQNAVNYVASVGGGALYFPRGDYAISSSLTVSASGVKLRGAGAGAFHDALPPNTTSPLGYDIAPTRLLWTGATDSTSWMVKFAPANSSAQKLTDVEMTGICLVGTPAYTSGPSCASGLLIYSCQHSLFDLHTVEFRTVAVATGVVPANEAANCEGLTLSLRFRQINTTGTALVLGGSQTGNTCHSRFPFIYGNRTSGLGIDFQAVDNCFFGKVWIYAVGSTFSNPSTTRVITFRGSTSTRYGSISNTIKHMSGSAFPAGIIYSEGTETSGVSTPAAWNRIEEWDDANAPIATQTGTGASFFWASNKHPMGMRDETLDPNNGYATLGNGLTIFWGTTPQLGAGTTSTIALVFSCTRILSVSATLLGTATNTSTLGSTGCYGFAAQPNNAASQQFNIYAGNTGYYTYQGICLRGTT